MHLQCQYLLPSFLPACHALHGANIPCREPFPSAASLCSNLFLAFFGLVPGNPRRSSNWRYRKFCPSIIALNLLLQCRKHRLLQKSPEQKFRHMRRTIGTSPASLPDCPPSCSLPFSHSCDIGESPTAKQIVSTSKCFSVPGINWKCESTCRNGNTGYMVCSLCLLNGMGTDRTVRHTEQSLLHERHSRQLLGLHPPTATTSQPACNS